MSSASAFEDLQTRVHTKTPLTTIGGLEGLGIAHTLLELAKLRPVVVVPKSQQSADDLLRDLRALAGAAAEEILHVPADERTPFHTSSPDPLAVMERCASLFRLATDDRVRVCVIPPQSLIRRTVPYGALANMAEFLCAGAEIERDAVIEKLSLGGYSRVNTVEDAGTFALRGSILDIFWPGAPYPARIDLFGDEIDTIKYFDPATQLTVGTGDAAKLEAYTFGPVREVHLTDAAVKHAKQALRDLADEVEFPTKKLRELLDDLSNRIPFFGIEGLLPAFYDNLQTPLEIASAGLSAYTLVVEDEASIADAAGALEKHYLDHHRQALTRGDLCFEAETFLTDIDTAFAAAKDAPKVVLKGAIDLDAKSSDVLLRTTATGEIRQDILKETMRRDDDGAANPHGLLAPLARRIQQLQRDKNAVLLPVGSLGGTERLKDLLSRHHLEVRVLKAAPDLLDPQLAESLFQPSVHAYTYVGRPMAPARGAHLPHRRLSVISEEEIFGRRARREGTSGKRKGFKTTLDDLEAGDYIVHVDHGIGIFGGLTRLNLRGVEGDFVLLTYAGDDKLYLPVHRINQIQRYSGAEGKKPRIDKLGGTGWQTAKKKVKKAVLAMAQELLNIYAKRELSNRPSYPSPDETYWAFEAAFPFEPTPDQQKAIDDTLKDMQSKRPMDRLICGDVGYGKTEVGMRAAMMAVLGHKQVAVLAPTTVLAQQHFMTFKERFDGFPVTIEVISRFRKSSEVKDILKRTAEGKVDILIGTHRLLSNDVSFDKLGLLVVDEEQRFGVKAKEAMKRLRASADILTMTATPIPRTLQMGFFGIRDMSVIETPPVDRRAIRTEIMRFDDDVIREAMLRELGRGGQVYFVHNRVRSIAAMEDYLKRLVPEARIGVGHGQLSEKELENVMVRFMKHELNVLLCTTIIETGIDVPTANTMFIDHADEFGLSQLYQLRGRVGRSKDRAFAYLLIPGTTERLSPDARKRLEVLQRFSELGAGFKVAQHDLELRGAGDLLGKSQHGHVTAVGYDMYTDLLKDAVEELKGRTLDDVPEPDINLPVAALIPDKYIHDVQERLSAYQRLATAKDGEQVYDVIGVLADRYGDPPAEVIALADIMILKQRLREMAARALELGSPMGSPPGTPPLSDDPDAPPPRVVITLGEKTLLDAGKLTKLVQESPDRFKLTPQMKLVYIPTPAEWVAVGAQVIPLCRDLCRRILEIAK